MDRPGAGIGCGPRSSASARDVTFESTLSSTVVIMRSCRALIAKYHRR
jgi:hypothetical protein